VTGNTVVDALFMELARQEEPDVRAAIEGALSALLGPDWALNPFVLITGHRRENFGDGI
jgi:UDP-N-acetylglucosamine 2-epimerase (non-hydrolysing)